jgi:hypothetical protein
MPNRVSEMTSMREAHCLSDCLNWTSQPIVFLT